MVAVRAARPPTHTDHEGNADRPARSRVGRIAGPPTPRLVGRVGGPFSPFLCLPDAPRILLLADHAPPRRLLRVPRLDEVVAELKMVVAVGMRTHAGSGRAAPRA